MQGLVSKAAALGYVTIRSGIAPALRGGAMSVAALALGSLLLSSCGDDDGGGDGGTGDSGMDGGDDDFTRPRRDGSTGTDPVPECDRFDPLACGAGQRCQLVLRRAAGEMQFLIYPGCVDDTGARAEGDPCDPWGGFFLPYRAEGLDDELHADPCGQGLYCALDSEVRGHFSCQRSCQSGFYEGFAPVACGADSYCVVVDQQAGPFEEVCIGGDECDPTDPEGCAPGVGCYLRLNDAADGALSVCLATLDPPLEDGAACQTYRDCRPGSSCWGPPNVPATRWTMTDLRCRRSCTVGEDGDDAGADDGEDGGVSGGRCGECVAFDDSGIDVSSVSETLGLCE